MVFWVANKLIQKKKIIDRELRGQTDKRIQRILKSIIISLSLSRSFFQEKFLSSFSVQSTVLFFLLQLWIPNTYYATDTCVSVCGAEAYKRGYGVAAGSAFRNNLIRASVRSEVPVLSHGLNSKLSWYLQLTRVPQGRIFPRETFFVCDESDPRCGFPRRVHARQTSLMN